MTYLNGMSIDSIILTQLENEVNEVSPSLPRERPTEYDRTTIAPPKNYDDYMTTCKILGE